MTVIVEAWYCRDTQEFLDSIGRIDESDSVFEGMDDEYVLNAQVADPYQQINMICGEGE